MKCSEYIKSKGVKSLAFLAEESGASERTLQNWYEKKRKLFDTVIDGVRLREEIVKLSYENNCDGCSLLGYDQ